MRNLAPFTYCNVFLARAFFHWTAEAEAMQVALVPQFNQK
jgi:hypothetical protein